MEAIRIYKFVFSDIDGTLHDDKGNLSRENLLAIQKLHEMGIQFVPTSGRTLSEMTEISNIPQIRYVIYSNGSVIYDKEADTYTYMCIPNEIAKDVFGILFDSECYIIVHYDGKNCVRPFEGYEELKRYNINPIIYNLLETGGVQMDNFEEFVMALDNIESIAVFFSNKEEEVRCKEILSKDDRLFLLGAWSHNFEIFSADAGKENAIKKLLDILKIDFKDVIYLGDNENDIEALKLAGLGLCVGNGSEKAKKVADKVICTNNENVVEYTLNEILLK